LLEGGIVRATKALAPRVVPVLSVKSTEYLTNPVSSILYPASWSFISAAFCSKKYDPIVNGITKPGFTEKAQQCSKGNFQCLPKN
jgi:hypothetical protein